MTEIQGGVNVDLKNDLPLKLKEYRKANKINQIEMAKLIGISRSYYSDVESGRYLPSGNVINTINSKLNFFTSKWRKYKEVDVWIYKLIVSH